MSSSELFPMPSEPDSPAVSARGESQSLYRKYRPQSFEEHELVGQEHVVQTLRNAITLDRVAHAYLFCGPRGTGKTTTARLLAKAVNCLDPNPGNRPCNVCSACVAINTGATTDVIEIDAASNRGIDDIRDLRERVKYAPTQLATKFYIIDEAHQITGAAANAFLKTLEEPPAHTRFVLATTDPEELLQTIVSRCQRFDFRRISLDAMVRRLETIVAGEGLKAERPALEAIGRHATGSLRDAVGLLDQLSVYQEERGEAGEQLITVDAVRTLLGISRNDRIVALVNAIADRDAKAALELVNEAVDAGEDARQINRQLVGYLRELMFARAEADRGHDQATKDLAKRFSITELSDHARRFSEVDFRIKRSLYGQLPLEIALVESVTTGQVAAAPVATAPAPTAPRQMPTAATPPPAAQPEPIRPEPASRGLASRVRQPPAQPPSSARQDEPLTFAPPPGIVRTTPLTPPSSSGGSAGSSAGQAPTPVRSATAGNEPLTVDRMAELWTQIKLDVKAIDRRVEALLAASDPHAIVGNEVQLVTPYDFHARKLNEDSVRNTIAEVIEHIFGKRVTVVGFQIGNTPKPSDSAANEPSADPAPAPTEAAPRPVEEPSKPSAVEQPTAVPEMSESDILEQRTKAAMAIFDAVPVDDPNQDQ